MRPRSRPSPGVGSATPRQHQASAGQRPLPTPRPGHGSGADQQDPPFRRLEPQRSRGRCRGGRTWAAPPSAGTSTGCGPFWPRRRTTWAAGWAAMAGNGCCCQYRWSERATGARRISGGVVRAVLEVLHDFVSTADVDVVLVLNSSPAFAAVQAERIARCRWMADARKTDSVVGPTSWLRWPGAGSWCCSSAPGRAPTPDFPSGTRCSTGWPIARTQPLIGRV